MIEWIAVGFSVTGAYLVTGNKVFRFYGFSLWVVANAIWVYLAYLRSDYSQIVLFFVFLILALKGVYNNKI